MTKKPDVLFLGNEVAHPERAVEVSLEAVTSTWVIFGKRGSGKSNAGIVLAEEMCKVGAPWAALDPVGHFWGIRSRPDGSPGFPVLVFGGPHADLPLEHTAGALMADVLCDTRVQMVLCTVLFSGKERAQFVTAFAERLLSRVLADPFAVHVFLEEADSFAPQRPMAGEERMLGAVDKLMRRGRQGGLGMTAITQRSAKINKDITTQAETLLAFRTLGPQDRNAIDEWVKFHDSGEQRQELLSSLATLSDGESWMWSPEWLDFFGRVQWRRRETFDAASTPKVGERKVSPTLADVDLEQLRARMAATIERAKADDPKTLRARIAQLERERAEERAHPLKQVQTVTVEAPILTATAIEELRGIVDRADAKGMELLAAGDALVKAAQTLNIAIAHVDEAMGKPKLPTPAAGRATRPRDSDFRHASLVAPTSNGDGDAKLGKGETTVLAVLAQRPDGITQNQLAFLAGYSAKASTIGVILARLRQAGFVAPGQPIRPTAAGLAVAGGAFQLPTGAELLAHWFAHPRVGEGERRVLQVLIDAYPSAMSNDELCEVTGYSPTASTIGVILSRLRKLGLVETGARRAQSEFMEALRGSAVPA